MNILYDENIPFGAEAFAALGPVRSCAGRAITAAMVKDVDLLFVRSVTKIDAPLLEGSRVSFVATATSGSDHVDKAYLAHRGIAFVDAIGSNANSVAEYIAAALLTLGERKGWTLAGKTIGVIGVGHVGALVVKKAEALGMKVLLNDPPRQRAEKGFPGVSLREALNADVVAFHVPLTDDGPDPTRHMLDARTLDMMKPGAVLLQSCRGEVHDSVALKRAIASGRIAAAVIDVWENEPNADAELLEMAAIATPHIAGYSWPSKVLATRIIHEAACRHLGIAPLWTPPRMPNGCSAPIVAPGPHAASVQQLVRNAVKSVYDIEADDRRMRSLLSMSVDQRGAQFDLLRKSYPVRLEFQQARMGAPPPAAVAALRGLGFAL